MGTSAIGCLILGNYLASNAEIIFHHIILYYNSKYGMYLYDKYRYQFTFYSGVLFLGECIDPCIGNTLKNKGKVDIGHEENGNVENTH